MTLLHLFSLNKKKKMKFLGWGSFFFLCLTFIIFVSSNMAHSHPIPQNDLSTRVIQTRLKKQHLRAPIGIIVASDRLRPESGLIAEGLLEKEGYPIEKVLTVKNLEIENALKEMLQDSSIQVILCIGGTGISPHDVTIEAVNAVIQKPLPGFGELFRYLTYTRFKSMISQIGLLSLDTRAIAGLRGNVLIFAIPGSPNATTLALKEIIIPELPFLLGQLKKNDRCYDSPTE